jgi:phenylacetic acid degradation operon negative regulatory protein
MTIESASRKLVAEFRSRRTLRTGSLITTVFGDSIAPRGGTAWLGSLIAVMNEFGVSERLVRTSAFRLVQDGWLQSTLIGRRSYYSLTATGRERFEHATQKIYGEPVTTWDHNWCLILLSDLAPDSKDVVRKELGWLGFGTLSTNTLAHPKPDHADLDATLVRLGVADKLVMLSAQLPAELLPAGWHGTAAYQLCRNLYIALFRQADDYLSTMMETADGPLPPPSPDFMQRFGGLDT